MFWHGKEEEERRAGSRQRAAVGISRIRHGKYIGRDISDELVKEIYHPI